GGSGVGRGNFLEIGPLDVDLKPRNTSWLKKADLIFVVGLACRIILWASATATRTTRARWRRRTCRRPRTPPSSSGLYPARYPP
ncbi:hypothetical protein EE612_017845, partial [Oryza sativa]